MKGRVGKYHIHPACGRSAHEENIQSRELFCNGKSIKNQDSRNRKQEARCRIQDARFKYRSNRVLVLWREKEIPDCRVVIKVRVQKSERENLRA